MLIKSYAKKVECAVRGGAGADGRPRQFLGWPTGGVMIGTTQELDFLSFMPYTLIGL